MAYGLWLYKEVQGKDGLVRLEIKKKEYNGESIEIDALIKDSITLSMDGTEITDPIIGTTLTFSIADTEQIDTSLFFTPDATMYEVLLYVAGVKIWDGFLTPDSYQENLAYRDVINLTARDNLGRLNDFIFTSSQGMMNISSLLPTLLQEVGVVIDYAWHTKKKSTASADISDYNSIFYSYVNTDYFTGKTYRDILEEILLSIGCQLRYTYTDSMGYHLGIYDISQLPTIDSVGAIFIEKSGLKEIRPAWREVTITQQYQLIESFYRGQFSQQMCNDSTIFMEFDPAVANPEYWRQSSDSAIMLVNPWEWTATSIFKQDLYDDYSNHIYIPVIKVDKENDIPTTQEYIAYHQVIPKAERGISIKLMINNSLRTAAGFLDFIVGSFNMKFRFNVVLKTSEKEYFLRDYWVENDPNGFLEFDLEHRQGRSTNKNQQVDIIINNIPEDGEIELRIYQPITISNSVVGAEGYALIKDIQMSYNIEMSGQSSRVEINKKHNIKSSLDLPYGQVPILRGGYLSFANGFFASNGKALTSWKLTPDNIISYNLLELVAREHIHFNKDNYTILSGTMIGNGVSISLANNIAYKGKKYAIISASHSIISGTLNVSKMQEVTPYQVAELTIIDSPLELSSGSRVGSGNNEVIQFSNDAGNAKRVYELETATLDDLEDSYVLIDKSTMPSAKRIPYNEIAGVWDIDEEGNVKLRDGVATKRDVYNIGKLSMGTLVIPNGEGIEGEWILKIGALGAGADTPSAGEGLSEVTIYLGSTPYKSDANGVITLPAYPTGGGSGTNDWNAIINKPTTLAGYGITDALSLSGGMIDGNLTINSAQGPWNSIVNFANSNGFLGAIGVTSAKEPTFYSGSAYHTLLHSGNIGSYKSGSADYISNSTYYYDGNVLTNDVSAYSLFGSIPTDNRMFSAFMQNHPTWSGWADVAHFTGYCMYGATQLATEYNAISPRVAIRKYTQTRSDWGDWVEFITTANIGSQSVNYAITAKTLANQSASLDLNNQYNPLFWFYGQSDSGIANTPSDFTYGGGLMLRQDDSPSLNGQFVWAINHASSAVTRGLWFRASNNLGWDATWHRIAFTDSTVAATNSVYSPNGREVVIVNDTSAVEVFGSVAYDSYIDGRSLIFRYGSSYTPAITITSGNVGIGTVNPSVKLDVVGGQVRVGASEATDTSYGKYHGFVTGYHNIDYMDFYEAEFNFYYNGGGNGCSVNVYGNIYANGYQLPASPPDNPVSGGYYLYVGTLGAGAAIS